VGNNGRVQAALSVVNAGGVVNGPEFVNSPANLAVIPVPTGAINLPRGSAAPGNVNINIASDSITLAPGNYVVANLNVNYMGTWNGWLSVPCTPFNQLPSELQRFPYIGGGQGVIPGYLNGGINEYGTMPGIHTADANGLKFGQVETTVVNIAPSTPNQPAEDDFCFNLQPGFCSSAHSTPNTFSVASLVTVPRFGSGFIGPIPWIAPQTVDPHQCLLAIIKGTQEPAPLNLTDTPNSNQIAQRNIEVGNNCAWNLVNGTGANGTGAITIKTVTGTVDGQPYTPVAGEVIQVQFADQGGQTFLTHWPTPPGANPPYTVTYANNVTTVQLFSTGFVVLPSVSLAANLTTSVTSQVIPALFSGTVIDLQISAALSNGGTFPVVSNGASCQATATQGRPSSARTSLRLFACSPRLAGRGEPTKTRERLSRSPSRPTHSCWLRRGSVTYRSP